MIIPMDLLEGAEGNVYELTCAAIRRAYQISKINELEEEEQDKVVPTAIKQILTEEVQYRLED